MSVINETTQELVKSINSLVRRRPLSKKNQAEYRVMAYQLERTAAELRRKASEIPVNNAT